jgi:hypothetical protein
MYTEVTFNFNNWDKILLCSLLLAQKLWDDTPLANVDFPAIWQVQLLLQCRDTNLKMRCVFYDLGDLDDLDVLEVLLKSLFLSGAIISLCAVRVPKREHRPQRDQFYGKAIFDEVAL